MKISSTTFKLSLIVVVLIVFISFSSFSSSSSSAANLQGAVPVPVSIQSQQFVRVIAPSSSNITVLSIWGGQYDLSLTTLPGLNQLQFTPANATVYTLLVNVSASSGNFAYITKQNGMYTTLVRNVTGLGNILLNLTITSTAAVQQGSSWDPLFGFTGLRIDGFSLGFPAMVAIVFGLGVGLLALGIKFHSFITYIGLSILSIGIIMILGILVTLTILVVYVLSFVGVSVFWKLDARKRNR